MGWINGRKGVKAMNPDMLQRERDRLQQQLIASLPLLRAAIGISQEEIAGYIGISRQTYCALEQGKRKAGWNTFLALFVFFISNEDTYTLLKAKQGFVPNVYRMLQYRNEETADIQYSQGF